MMTNDLDIFARVVELGSFAAVAEERGVAPSSISRRIAALEHQLKARLFHRDTRNMQPTSAGEHFYEQIAPLLADLYAAQEGVMSGGEKAVGTLRVAASPSFGQYVLASLLARFRQRYPDIRLELLLSDNKIDMISERVDLAIRHGQLHDSDLVVTKLAETRYLAVAGKGYLAKSEPLLEPGHLKYHSCLAFNLQNFRSNWTFRRNGASVRQAIRPVIETSNAATLAEFVRRDSGIALLAEWMAGPEIQKGKMVRVLPDWEVSGEQQAAIISIVSPSRQYRPLKTEVLRKFLIEEYPKHCSYSH